MRIKPSYFITIHFSGSFYRFQSTAIFIHKESFTIVENFQVEFLATLDIYSAFSTIWNRSSTCIGLLYKGHAVILIRHPLNIMNFQSKAAILLACIKVH